MIKKITSWASLLATLSMGLALSAVEVRHALNFKVFEEEGEPTRMEVYQNCDPNDLVMSYILLREGETTDVNSDVDTQIVRIPLQRAVLFSSTHLGKFNVLDLHDRMVGFSSKKFVNDENVHRLIDEGKIAEIGMGPAMNSEMVVAMNSDGVFLSASGETDSPLFSKFQRMGIPMILTSSWMEQSPLGRAEWIKFFAMFFDKTEEAEVFFSDVEEKYLQLKSEWSSVEDRPKVMLNAPWGDAWYVGQTDTYAAHLVRDAGGDYLWDDLDGNRAIPVAFEVAYERVLKADYWLNTGQSSSITELCSQDARFAALDVVKNGKVFNNNKRIHERGGRDFFESGSVRPDVVLHDLIQILHPEQFPEPELYYYRNLE